MISPSGRNTRLRRSPCQAQRRREHPATKPKPKRTRKRERNFVSVHSSYRPIPAIQEKASSDLVGDRTDEISTQRYYHSGAAVSASRRARLWGKKTRSFIPLTGGVSCASPRATAHTPRAIRVCPRRRHGAPHGLGGVKTGAVQAPLPGPNARRDSPALALA